MKTIEDDKQVLRSKAFDWAARLKVEPKIVRVQRMTRKWGSCSTSGTVTLAQDLTEASPEFQDFVIAHELLHLRVPNHGKLFKALMTVYVPNWKHHEINKDQAKAQAT
ncbi:MAG: metal-dependent hydrolase [Halochromatium sp.]|nr:metal-dependent hydrolase [Halochromatium sp.]